MIPKVVHVTWKTKDILNSSCFIIENGLRQIQSLNLDWTINVYDDHEVDTYLKENLSYNDYKLIENVHIVEKSDLWRLFKIYIEGGMYVDIDRLCNKSMSSIIDATTKWVLPTYRDFDFSHDIMISAPSNPVYQHTIDLYLERRRHGETNVYFLGPQTYMHSITQSFFGKMINSDPGQKTFDWIRQEIGKFGFVKLYKETGPYDTVLYSGDKVEFDFEKMKRQLYQDHGIKHWTGEW